MSEEEVHALPAESKASVRNLRDALLMPVDAIHRLDPRRRDELLGIREQLIQFVPYGHR